MLHFFVRIEDHMTGRIAHEPRRGPEAQRTMLGLFQRAAQEAAAQPVQFRLTPGAFELCYL